MISLKLCRNTLLRFMVALVIVSSLVVPPAFCQEPEDSQVFITGFNAYQQKDYATAIEKMNEVLQKHPDTPLRDMALFWLSRSYFKAGNHQEAARYLSKFSKEYPDNPLKGTVEEELLALAARYDKGEKLPVGTPATKQPDRLAVQKLKAEKERLAAEKAEEAQRTAAVAEAARVAALKQTEEKVAAEKQELERIASLKLETERLEREKAEQLRIATLKQDQERIAAVKAENERLAKEKAEREKIAAEKAEQLRIASLKAEAESKAAAQAEQQRLEREKAEQLRIATLKQDQERIAAVKAENERLAREKSEREKVAAEKAEQLRIASLKAEEESKAAAQAEQQRLELEKAEKQRIAALKQEQEQERIAAVKAENERLAREKSELERVAAEKTEQQRLALLKAEEAKQAAITAEAAKMAALKAEQERKMAEKAALDADNARLADAKAEELRLAQQRISEEKTKASKAVLREKAIEQYKSIIESYPATLAATTAAAKLRELGIAVALPPKMAAAEVLPENAQVLRLEVAQFAGFEFNLLARPESFTVDHQISVPFEIVNRGNGNDSFALEAAFPADFKASFAGAASPDLAITQTPDLAPGESFKGIVNLVIPAGSIDGLRITHPVKAASRLMPEASQSREVRLIASAPLLRAVLKSDKTQPLPGEKIVYRIAIMNVGSTAAQNVTFRLNFPPQFEPLDFAAAGFKLESKSVLTMDGLQISSGESRELNITFQLKDDSLAGQELSTRAELINNKLKTTAAFISNLASVQAQRGIFVRNGSERVLAIPGQTVTVPFVITNTGNVREKFKIASNTTGSQNRDVVVFHDINRDGLRQASELVISEIGPLAPKEEASVVMEIKTPKSALDGSEEIVLLSFSSEGEATRTASGSTKLQYSRPVLHLAMAGRDGRLKPGEVASFNLTITNSGSNLAKVVELQSTWPDQLELVAADPANSTFNNGNITWHFKELGANEKRSIKVSFRVKPGTGVGTSLQVKNVMTYEDQIGNRY